MRRNRERKEEGPSADASELSERETLLAAQFADSPDGILVVDAEGTILLLNDRFRELSALPEDWPSLPQAKRQEALYRMLSDPKEGAAFTTRAFADLLAEATAEFRLADGRCVEVSSRPLWAGTDRLLGRVFYYRDISARKAAEDALRASEALFHTVAEAAPCGIWLQRAGSFRYVNPRLEQLTGYPREQLLKPGFLLTLLHPADREAVATGIAERSQGPAQPLDVDLRIVSQDGETHWIRLRTGVATIEGEAYGLGAAIDITEAKHAEEDRDRIFNVSVDMLAVLDHRSRFLRLNPAWTSTTGYRTDELLGQPIWDFVHPDDRAEGLIERARAGGQGILRDIRTRFRHKSRHEQWLSWSFRADASDHIYCAVRDVTEQIATEERLQAILEALKSNSVALEEHAVELERLRTKAEYEASHDALTDLINRRAWFAATIAKRPTAVALFDVDHFKLVNDTYGHPTGDVVLQEVAARLSSAIEGAGCFVGRVGGEEFAATLRGDWAGVSARVERALEGVRETPILLEEGSSINVTMSAGLVPWRSRPRSREESLAATYREADAALLAAKRSGRDRMVVRALDAA